MTRILSCNCRHKFQDQKYGTGNRLHNRAPKAFNGRGGWRCTVCLDVKQASLPQPSAAEEGEQC